MRKATRDAAAAMLAALQFEDDVPDGVGFTVEDVLASRPNTSYAAADSRIRRGCVAGRIKRIGKRGRFTVYDLA